MPAFSARARYLALVPKQCTPDSAARRQRMSGSAAGIGAPSYSTSVAPTASPLTNQFHIIQPQVVK